MRAQQDLQVALRERYRRCLTQSFQTLGHETELTRNWVRTQPALMGLLEDAARTEPDLDPGAWLDSFNGHGQFKRPSKTEAGTSDAGLVSH